MKRQLPFLFVAPLLIFFLALTPLATPTQVSASPTEGLAAPFARSGPLNAPSLETETPQEGLTEEPSEDQLPGGNPADVEVVLNEVITDPAQMEAAMFSALPSDGSIISVNPQRRDGYIPNPGIGWQEAHNVDAPMLPETVSYRRPEYNWKLLNPSSGVYNWEPLDRDLRDAIDEGRQFSFRIYTMRGVSYGGHQMPGWVFDEGVALRGNGEPDYANCAYQEQWARFVNALRSRYDGNSHIAFIDISGYGEFNEWNYGDYTTWEDGTLDSMARQRLADMFIGGSATIQCRDWEWDNHTVSYNYPGFQRTQLVMPYGGIQKTTRYVAGRRPDVGIRHDCLGSERHTDSLMEKVGDVVAATWRNAPIIFEFCGNSDEVSNFFSSASETLQAAHGSIVHDNLSGTFAASVVASTIQPIGYRFVMKRASAPSSVVAGNSIEVSMTWTNTGYAPAYARMGQDLLLRAYLLDPQGRVQHTWNLRSDPNSWMPADPLPGTAPDQSIRERLRVPGSLAGGTYTLATAIVSTRDWKAVQLAIQGQDNKGRFALGQIRITETNRVLLPVVFQNRAR